MQPERHLVRANGRYYRLSQRDYLIYKIFSNAIWFFLILFAVASAFIRNDRIGPAIIPHELWLIVALGFGALAYAIPKIIASRGIPVEYREGSDPGITEQEQSTRAFINANTLNLIIISGFLGSIIILAIVAGLIQHRPPKPILIEGLLLTVLGFGLGVFRLRKARAQWRRVNSDPVIRPFAIGWLYMAPTVIIIVLVLAALYNLWIAAAQHPTVAQQRCSPRDAATWTLCADGR